MWGYRPGKPVIGSTPPAGQPFEYEVSQPENEAIQAVTFELVTSSHASSRVAFVAILDGSGEAVAAIGAPFTQGLSLTSLYSFFVGGAQFGANNAPHIGGPLPAVTLGRTMKLTIGVDTIDSADQIQKVRLFVVPVPLELRDG